MTIDALMGPAVGAIIALVIALLGWVWQLSNKTAQVDFLDRRMTALEKTLDTRSARIDEIADRLSRIEPLIAFAVDQLKINMRLGSTAD